MVFLSKSELNIFTFVFDLKITSRDFTFLVIFTSPKGRTIDFLFIFEIFSFNADKISEEEILNLDPEALFLNSNYMMSGDEEDCIESYEFRVKVKESNGCNTSGRSPVITVPISIVTTQPINHN